MGQPWSQDLYIKTYKFAAEAHKDQKVPGSDLPYIAHLTFVCMEIMGMLQEEETAAPDLAIQCALLHDCIEDQGCAHQQLADLFGRRVADGVQALSKNPALPKARQMPDSLARIQQQPSEIWMVKMADRITNLQPPPAHWSVDKIAAYRLDAIAILDALGSASPYLAARMQDKIETYAQYAML